MRTRGWWQRVPVSQLQYERLVRSFYAHVCTDPAPTFTLGLDVDISSITDPTKDVTVLAFDSGSPVASTLRIP